MDFYEQIGLLMRLTSSMIRMRRKIKRRKRRLGVRNTLWIA